MSGVEDFEAVERADRELERGDSPLTYLAMPPFTRQPISSMPTLLQEIAWFLRDYAETLDRSPHPRLDGLRRDVDRALAVEPKPGRVFPWPGTGELAAAAQAIRDARQRRYDHGHGFHMDLIGDEDGARRAGEAAAARLTEEDMVLAVLWSLRKDGR